MAARSRAVLTAEWRYITIVNYTIDPDHLWPLVPPGTELDRWEGRTYVSLVGLVFRNTRVFGIPVPFHRSFEQINLRFYVRRRVDAGWRRGVVFVKEIVRRRAIAAAARILYREGYIALPLRHTVEPEGGQLRAGSRVEYRWRHRGRWNRLAVTLAGQPAPAAPGSEAEFITEHYWGYRRRGGGETTEFRLERPRWRLWPAGEAHVDCDARDLYGDAFVDMFASQPTSAFMAEGGTVSVLGAHKLPRHQLRARPEDPSPLPMLRG